MSGMFQNCESLNSLNLKHFNTFNVTDMLAMFGLCYNLETLDISNFNTSNVTTMETMFYSCYSLISLDLSGFSFSKEPAVTNFLGEHIGMLANDQPIPIKVTEEGYTYLTETTTDCGIGTSAKFVKPDGTNWITE